MAGAGGANMGKFEEYFQMADLDRDGRISGAEAVGFLQRSNLPRQVLAQIWMHADQNRTGFLSRPEFYNALKLVTVVQSKRELTPEIVKSALYGPASSRIPPPQISTAGTPVPHPNSVAAPPLPQTGAMPQPIQNFGFRGPAPSSNQQFGALQSTMGIQSVPVVSSSGMNPHFGSALSSSGISQQFAQVQPSSAMNQQFGQVRPTNTGMNQQFGQLQPSSTGINQQFSQVPSSMNLNQNFLPSQTNQPMRSPQSMLAGHASHLPQATISPNISVGMAGPGLPNSSNELPGGKSGLFSARPATQVLDRGASLSGMPGAPNTQDQLSKFSSAAANDAMALIPTGNKSTLDPMFAGGLYSTNQSPSPQVSSAPQLSISLPTASVATPVTSNPQPLPKPDPFEALQSTLMKPSTGIQVSPRPTLPNQQSPRQVTSAVQAGVGNSPPEQSQISWPKMTHPGIQKYAKVFMQVDSDRDGKITGDQARNLFLSWRLPREVLKQIWDFADQDSDSMLSLREFCIALYLMEQYREGHSLPPTLPNSVMFDETLLSLAGPPSSYGSPTSSYGTMGWGPTTGFRPQQSFPSPQFVTPTGIRPPMQPMVSQPKAYMQFNQKNARGPVLDSSHVDKPSNEEANSLESKGLEAENIDEKAGDTTNVILDSREKLEFYRTKMQDLVLYKSRCDNHLNEITERARADKTEAELLEKKYQEKYKQVAEIHSTLMMEEASFREIQARKTELQQAIIKMEQGGSADGILQVRADRIQSDLEELLKALVDCCKKHSIEIVSAALIELPTGWQPGIPEAAALWDENWDKFEDEGFSFDIVVPETAGSRSDHKDHASPTHSLYPDSLSNATKFDKLYGVGASDFDAESVNSGNESRSPQGCPGRQTITSSQDYSDNHFRKSFDGDAEIRRSFDKPVLGNFDNEDDIDSIWGFNAKDSDHAKHEERYFFGSADFGTSPERRESPHADSTFQITSPFTLEDSFPGSPFSRAGNSSRHSVDSKDHSLNNFSEYDSFDTHDMSSSSHLGNLTRFDSINSTRDFGHSSNFSFDDSDPFGSTGPFKASSETPEKSLDSPNAF